jgi:hypothetical protein
LVLLAILSEYLLKLVFVYIVLGVKTVHTSAFPNLVGERERLRERERERETQREGIYIQSHLDCSDKS